MKPAEAFCELSQIYRRSATKCPARIANRQPGRSVANALLSVKLLFSFIRTRCRQPNWPLMLADVPNYANPLQGTGLNRLNGFGRRRGYWPAVFHKRRLLYLK